MSDLETASIQLLPLNACLRQICTQLSGIVPAPIYFNVADSPLSLSHLTEGERAQYATLKHPKRQHSWLLGRAALKQLLAAHHQNIDTSLIQFPHPQLSLTHTQRAAVAIACFKANISAGLGIDLEQNRSISESTARFFLSPEEQAMAKETTVSLLQLWTIKEALFKSDVQNKGKTLLNYAITGLQPVSGMWVGTATINLASASSGSIQWASQQWTTGFVSAAVALPLF